MRTLHRALLTASSLAGLALAPACSAAVADLGSATEDESACRMDGNRNSVRDFRLELRELSPHVTHYFEGSIVDGNEGTLRARLIVAPLELGTQNIVVEDMVPPGDYFFDFYADIDGDTLPDVPPTDHTWQRRVCSDGVLHFVHIFEFETLEGAIAIGPNATLTLTNVPASLATIGVESRFVFASEGEGEGRTVGMFRLGAMGTTAVMTVPEIIDSGSDYAVMWYLDMDADNVPGDGDVFCGRHMPGATTLDLSVDLTAAMEDGTCGLTSLDYTQVLPE